jgi:exopolyphosphatase/guanosine-5'-triphosphate,3'-diphosphate pyrophosphatase
MTATASFTSNEARSIGEQIGVDWATAPFDVEQFRMGMDVELEHGLRDPQTDVTGSDPTITGKIALAHLREYPDYYTRLERMELEAEEAARDRNRLGAGRDRRAEGSHAAARSGERGQPTSAIIPRWEWRTFGDHFGPAEDRFAALSPERVQESDELYLLSAEVDENVKIRDGLLDIKQFERVNADGLEQWMPVMKASFPLPAAEVASVLARLRADVRTPARDVYTLEELVDEGTGPNGGLLAVHVHKRRQRYTIGGCTTELTELDTDVGATRTVAIESEEADRVIATVSELGLSSFPNVSFPRGLKALAGLDARRYAVIDVGTNSVKFHIGERRADGTWRTVVDRAEVTRLGEGLDQTGRLQPEPMTRTTEAIAAMADEAQQSGVEAIAAVGTAGLRIAPNSAELVDAVRGRCGVEIEVIPGEEEARLAYLAVKSGLGPAPGSLVVFDTGGGSSQFTFGHGENVDERFSVNVGAVRVMERFGLDHVVPEEALAEALAAIAADLGELDGRLVPDALVAMGGAVTNLAAVRHRLATYDAAVVQGTVLDLSEIDRQIELYRTRSAEARREIVGLQPKRAEIILAGACIVRTVMSKLGKASLTVSDRGLRHGLLVERFDRKETR